jgi:glycosyltransferase involved in cell wall biosynthesis
MDKKKILIFIDWYLPGYKAGGPIQSVSNLVDHLKEGFDIAIITRDTDYSESQPYENIKSNKWILLDTVRIYYISKQELNYSTIYKLMRDESFDYVYLNGIYSLYFTLIPLFILRKKQHQHIVIAARGMLSPGSLNVKKTKKQLFLRMIKMARLFSGITFHASTETEKREIQEIMGNKVTIKTAGNLPSLKKRWNVPERVKVPGTLHLVNIARIAPEKNLLLALKILQLVKTTVKFDFYGPVYDTAYWEKCKEVMAALPTNVTAMYKGSVASNHVVTVLEGAHFLFMPTSGENFGHIILQSLSTGCPVIISDQTPWKKLEHENCGWDIPLTQLDEYAGIIDRANKMDQVEFNALSRSALAYATKYMNDPKTLIDNKALFSG